MATTNILGKYLNSLLKGDRIQCRHVIEETLKTGMTANRVYTEIIWPIMLEVDKLYRDDKINSAQEALASRINRTIVDQLQNKLPRKIKKNKSIVICCALEESVELGAQIMADLFESDGWDVRFLGGTVNNDDILSFVNQFHPDVLLVHGIGPKRAPEVRQLIDKIKTIDAWPEMKIMLSGGVFDRAEGLWEEIGADIFASNATDAVKFASKDNEDLDRPTRTINRRKKRAQETEQAQLVG